MRRGYIPVTLEIVVNEIVAAVDVEAMAYVEENDGDAWLETLYVPQWDDVLWKNHVFTNCTAISDPRHSHGNDRLTADLFGQAEFQCFGADGILTINAAGYMMDEAA